MAQQRIMMNDTVIHQPDEGLKFNTETKYSQDSGRVQNGEAHITPLFTVEQYGYTATNVPQEKATEIIRIICTGKPFKLHYFSMFYGEWRDAMFYVGKGDFDISSLKEGEECVKTLSFNMTGVKPI